MCVCMKGYTHARTHARSIVVTVTQTAVTPIYCRAGRSCPRRRSIKTPAASLLFLVALTTYMCPNRHNDIMTVRDAGG